MSLSITFGHNSGIALAMVSFNERDKDFMDTTFEFIFKTTMMNLQLWS